METNNFLIKLIAKIKKIIFIKKISIIYRQKNFKQEKCKN
jgi:hypothetical protein